MSVPLTAEQLALVEAVAAEPTSCPITRMYLSHLAILIATIRARDNTIAELRAELLRVTTKLC